MSVSLTRSLTSLCSIGLFAVPCFAEPVQLKSPDGFISVEGEITSFDGTMVGVMTSVGPVKVPASEVVCFGNGCIEGIEVGSLVEVRDMIAPDQQFIGFLTNLATEYTAQDTTSVITGSSSDDVQLLLSDGAAELNIAIGSQSDSGADPIIIDMMSLNHGSDIAYNNALSWVENTNPASHILTIESLTIVTDARIGITSLSTKQLADIFSGQITNWNELGGPDQRIVPLLSAGKLLNVAAVQELVLDPYDYTINPQVIRVDESAILRNSISQFPGMIGLVNTRYIGELNTIPIVNSCGNEVTADAAAVEAGMYPLTMMSSVNYGDTSATEPFVDLFDFVSSATSVFAVAGSDTNIADLGIREKDANADIISRVLDLDGDEAEAGQELATALTNAQRTSIVLRAGALTDAEAAWNRLGLLRLENAIKSGDLDGKEIIFAGFVDGQDGVTDSLDRSREFSANMRAAFEVFAPEAAENTVVNFETLGFGGLVPQNCGDASLYKATSQRVEIWLRDAS